MRSRLPWIFNGLFAVNLAVITVMTHFWAAEELRHDGGPFWLVFCGAIWMLLSLRLFSWLGLSISDDVVERRNVAALAALCGAQIAVAFIFVGANAGEGPSFLENVFCAMLGTASLATLWSLVQTSTNITASITEERNLASGVRFAGLLVALGLILGRALAGDWHSASATLQDFIHDGWPGVLLTVIALPIEFLTRPNRSRPFPDWPKNGLLPAFLYLALAGAWLFHLGPWEGMRK